MQQKGLHRPKPPHLCCVFVCEDVYVFWVFDSFFLFLATDDGDATTWCVAAASSTTKMTTNDDNDKNEKGKESEGMA